MVGNFGGGFAALVVADCVPVVVLAAVISLSYGSEMGTTESAIEQLGDTNEQRVEAVKDQLRIDAGWTTLFGCWFLIHGSPPTVCAMPTHHWFDAGKVNALY